LPKDHYKYDEDQDEYIDNWVDQYDLLCEPKWRIGLIGSMYFAGILTTILIVPYLIDNCGRKYVTVISNFVLIGCTIGILIATDITSLYILLFFAGTSFGGRLIGGLNWLIEWCPWRPQVLFVKMLSGSFSIIIITAWF
jgi:MFS family permease